MTRSKSFYVSTRSYVSIRQHTSAYAYVRIRQRIRIGESTNDDEVEEL
jgi:hypothetical protein